MKGMGMHSAEEAPVRRDHLWVLIVIAAAALAEVWGSWVGIGSISGFPVLLGRIPTDWVLALVMEGYWAYGLYAWLAASPGPRSRSFAMWSCGVVFILSLVGQVTYHEMTVPPDTSMGRRAVVGFVTVLPVTGLALIAILIHLRHADREEAAAKVLKRLDAERRAAEAAARAERQAAIERAEADERTHLRAELERVTGELADTAEVAEARQAEAMRVHRMTVDAIQKRADDARADADKATARVALLERKLAGPARRSRTAPAGSGTAPRTAAGTAPDDDLDLEARALKLLATNLDMSGAELAKELEISPGYGRKLRRRLAGDRPAEEEPDRGEDRTGTASGDRSEDRA
jgi:hypothetical protein